MVKTKVIKVDPEIVDLAKMGMIIDALNNAGTIVYPTETFYGLGANFFSGEACQKIYELKQQFMYIFNRN